MTFKEIYEEVVARGFENIAEEEGGEARIKRWINEAYREVIDHRAWAFLRDEAEGKAPLTIEDLGHVISAVNQRSDSRLTFTTEAGLRHWDPTLESTGVATQWFLEGDSELHVYPTDAASEILVVYLKNPPDLKEDGDEPLVPAGYHGVIEDGAVLRAYKATDNYEAVGAVLAEFNRGLKSMRKNLRKAYDGGQLIQRTGSVNDYLG